MAIPGPLDATLALEQTRSLATELADLRAVIETMRHERYADAQRIAVLEHRIDTLAAAARLGDELARIRNGMAGDGIGGGA